MSDRFTLDPYSWREYARAAEVVRVVLDRVSFAPSVPLRGLKIRIGPHPRYGVEISYRAPDRETGQEIEVATRLGIPWHFESAKDPERVVLLWLKAQLGDIVLHELDESLLFDGNRVFDPHATTLLTVKNTNGEAAMDTRVSMDLCEKR